MGWLQDEGSLALDHQTKLQVDTVLWHLECRLVKTQLAFVLDVFEIDVPVKVFETARVRLDMPLAFLLMKNTKMPYNLKLFLKNWTKHFTVSYNPYFAKKCTNVQFSYHGTDSVHLHATHFHGIVGVRKILDANLSMQT